MRQRPIWTEAENELLRKLYPKATTTASLLPHFEGRNIQGLRMQAGRLKVKRLQAPGAWSDEHMQILRAYYPTHGAAYVAERVGRTPDRVRGYAYEHGISYCPPPPPARPPVEKRKSGPPVGTVYKPRSRKPAPEKPAKVVAPKPPKPPRVLAEPKPTPPKPLALHTPNLNAQKNALAAAKKAEAAKKQRQAVVPAAEIAKLPYDHPARMAYMLNARHGGAAANRAYHEAMNNLQQAA